MFGLISILSLFQVVFDSVYWFQGIMWFISIIITALSAGVIWGGLVL